MREKTQQKTWSGGLQIYCRQLFWVEKFWFFITK